MKNYFSFLLPSHVQAQFSQCVYVCDFSLLFLWIYRFTFLLSFFLLSHTNAGYIEIFFYSSAFTELLRLTMADVFSLSEFCLLNVYDTFLLGCADDDNHYFIVILKFTDFSH